MYMICDLYATLFFISLLDLVGACFWPLYLNLVLVNCQVISAKGQEVIDTALKADLVILNTAVAGKWLDAVLKERVPQVLPKILWWIHEMRGHYFKLEYVKHLPFVAGAMIDSHTTAEYWKNRTRDRLKYVRSAKVSYSICNMLFISGDIILCLFNWHI